MATPIYGTPQICSFSFSGFEVSRFKNIPTAKPIEHHTIDVRDYTKGQFKTKEIVLPFLRCFAQSYPLSTGEVGRSYVSKKQDETHEPECSHE